MHKTISSLFLTSYSLGETNSAWEKEELSPDWYMKDTKYPSGKFISFWHLIQKKKKKRRGKNDKLTFVKASKEDAND